MSFTVKHGSNSYQISIDGKTLVADIMKDLVELTNTHVRGQKLICKGKILQPDTPLTELKEGVKLMLMTTSGISQGSSMLEQKRASVRSSVSKTKTASTPLKSNPRLEIWKKTGQVSLRDLQLQEISENVWDAGTSIRVLDLSGNQLNRIPSKISNFTSLQRLRLSNNLVEDLGFPWEAVTNLVNLQQLEMDGNKLKNLPLCISEMHAIKRLNFARNDISELPEELGKLTELESLDLHQNKLIRVPNSLGECSSLAEVNLDLNFIKILPKTIGKLQKLKILSINNNAVEEVPSEILNGCLELFTFSLSGNPITIEKLREVEGWAEFDKRRREKYDKQVNFNTMNSSSGFEEGADSVKWRHW